ncbi:hypothetical protein LUZ60_007644 [Juncus effusus]|nr:hypothetical protein LUZ60_007644 [Juncus effusus]
MKIQCDVCERAEAAVLCCADEAALCWACDDVVHAANKLAGKHQRVPLLPRINPSSDHPLCDICQEKPGFFFCLEDRALLCRACDVAIHTTNNHVSKHQRYLITGVRVAVQNSLSNLTNSSSSNNNSSDCKNNNKESRCDLRIGQNDFKVKWTGPLGGGNGEEVWWNEGIGISDPGSSSLTGSKGLL